MKKRKKKKKLIIIEKPVYYGDKKFYIISKYIWFKCKLKKYFIIILCKMMQYKYEIV